VETGLATKIVSGQAMECSRKLTLGEPAVVAIVSYIHLAPYLGLLACLASSQKVGMVF